jgi:hypothetical protein
MTHIHLDRLAPNHLLTAAQSRGLYAQSECCKPALHPVINITLPPIAVPQQQALAGLNPNQSCLMHITARRHPRFSLLDACCEETLAISCMHNIFPICPATDWARLLHFPESLGTHLTHLGLWSAHSARRHAWRVITTCEARQIIAWTCCQTIHVLVLPAKYACV